MTHLHTWLSRLSNRFRREGELPASFYAEARRRAWQILAQAHVPGG